MKHKNAPRVGHLVTILKNGMGEDIPPHTAVVQELLSIQFTAQEEGHERVSFLQYNDKGDTWL